MGAVHCLDNLGITAGDEAPGYLRGSNPEKAAQDVADATAEIVESGLFTTIAHLDGIKKYARAFYGNAIDVGLEKRFPPVFEAMAKKNVGIELNTSALRRGHPDIYPSKKIVEMARDKGVKINSVGSDAHAESQVGFALEKAYTLIKETGIGIGEPLSKYF